jgi:hypothetical protein
MRMLNSPWVGSRLDGTTPKGAYPMVHLVLSGHTHVPFPDFGALPRTASACIHPDLGDDQCQLIAGTLMQIDELGIRGYWPHQCQILRFYYSASDHSSVVMNRLFAARGAGAGPYTFIPDSNGYALEEEMTFII